MSEDFNLSDFAVQNVLDAEKIEIKYIPITKAVLWEDNAKIHDFDKLIDSINEYGFRDPPAWDNTLQGIVEGNGRIEALRIMYESEHELPRGILKDKDTGEWCVPILFGLDANNKNSAIRYAVDHNNLVLSGGDFNAYDISRLWTKDGFEKISSMLVSEGEELISINLDELRLLTEDIDFEFEPDESDSEHHALDEEPDVYTITLQTEDLESVPFIKEALQVWIDENIDWDLKIT